MNSNELKNIIENARIAKGISQRELAKLSGISRSTLNDIINGKIKKVDVDSLKKIAETLDLSLTNLLKIAGYDEFLDYLSFSTSLLYKWFSFYHIKTSYISFGNLS